MALPWPGTGPRFRAGAPARRWLLATVLVLSPAMVAAEGVYLSAEEFRTQVFAGVEPTPQTLWLSAPMKDAAKDAGLPHLVLLSSVGAQHADGTGPVKTLHYAERRFRELPGFTSLRAAYFVENWGSVLAVAKSRP